MLRRAAGCTKALHGSLAAPWRHVIGAPRAQFSVPPAWHEALKSLGIGSIRARRDAHTGRQDYYRGPIVRTRAASVGGGMPTQGQAAWATGLVVLAICKVLGISPELLPGESVGVTLGTQPLTKEEAK